ncbi:MAG: class I SAM-dependent methyltransferase, partial [Dongiaceae bacterium]
MATLFGSRCGFFIPYRYADRLSAPGDRPAYASVERRFAILASQFAAQLQSVEEFADLLRAFGSQPAPAPRWEQDWFPRLDAAMAYAMVRQHRPSRIVEVG